MEKKTRTYVGKFDKEDRIILFIARAIIFAVVCAIAKLSFYFAEPLIRNHCWTEFFLKGGLEVLGLISIALACYMILAKPVECFFAAILVSVNDFKAGKAYIERSRIFQRTVVPLKVDLFVIGCMAEVISFITKVVKRFKKAYAAAIR